MRYPLVAVVLFAALLIYGCASQTAAPKNEPVASTTPRNESMTGGALLPATESAKPVAIPAIIHPSTAVQADQHHSSNPTLPGNVPAAGRSQAQQTSTKPDSAPRESQPTASANVTPPDQVTVSSNSIIAAICLVSVAFFLFILLRYQRSDSAKARKKLRAIVAQFESILSGQKKVSQESQDAIADAAREYVKEVRRANLQDISLDEVRKLAPGVRLQALYAHGVKDLYSCQGWTAANFQQLRGIGPDSAYRIAAACQTLTNRANNLPIRHPSISDGRASAKWIYAKIYAFGQVQATLHGQSAVLEGALQGLRPKRASVDSRTSILHWLFSSESTGPLKEAIDEVKTVEGQMAPDQELGRLLADATTRLDKTKGLGRSAISHEDLIADVASKDAFYRGSLDNFLGTEPADSTAQGVTGSEPPFLGAATQPVPVRTAGGGSSGYSIAGVPGLRIDVQIGGGYAPGSSTRMTEKAANCWVPAGRETKVSGYILLGGLIYAGRNLQSVHRQMAEPALIDPAQRVDRTAADCHVRKLTYWSNYSYASADARASYLQWLESGRNDPAADIGYVFLYFYGLERRALADGSDDPNAQAEIPAILNEVRRLRSIYAKNGSFAQYSAGFLEYLETTREMQSGFAETTEPPELEKYHLSFKLRRNLGLFAASGKPLPADWAYAWFHNDPRTRLPAAADRCPNEVASLFRLEYARNFGEGIVLPANKTQLKISYKPASGSFGAPLIKTLNLPDVSVLSTIYGKLQTVAINCISQIEGYSRFIARNKGQERSFDAFVQLPAALWPESTTRAISALVETAKETGTQHTAKFEDLLRAFPETPPLTKSKYIAFCRALGTHGIGIEPDIRFGGTLPSAGDPIALFTTVATENASGGFGIAALILQLASVVASSDGDFSDPEAQKLREHIEQNSGLPLSEQQRLLARMATFRVKAATTSGLKKSIDELNSQMRSGIVDFLLALVSADGVVAPGEVKVMEKIYGLFGMDASLLYARLHALAAHPGSPLPTAVQRTGPMELDKAKIEQLKAVSAEVTRKLTVIFDAGDEVAVESKTKETVPAEPDSATEGTLLHLDSAHAELLEVLLGRPQWTRAEFEELCSDKGLMPDGAIERINDAAFAKFDQALIEGDDPLEVSTQLLTEEKAA